MRTRDMVGMLCGLTVAYMLHESSATATWPSDGERTIAGSACYYSGDYYGLRFYGCPFVSDDTFFGGDNDDTYVDFHQVHVSGGNVAVHACWEPYGGASVCTTSPPETTTSGAQDVYVAGFGSLSAYESSSDSFQIEFSAWQDTIDTFYGVSYYQ